MLSLILERINEAQIASFSPTDPQKPTTLTLPAEAVVSYVNTAAGGDSFEGHVR